MNLRRLTGPLAILLIVVFSLLRFLHLEADFPYHYALSGDIYTDEGAYSNAAAAQVVNGRWFREGDFNPAVVLPVFQILQLGTFKLLGLTLWSSRLTGLALFLLLQAILFLLVRQMANVRTALIALLLVALNFNVFIFSRLALLEIPMAFFVVLSLWLAMKQPGRLPGIATLLLVLAYLAALLTKSFAIFALPSLIFILLTRPKPLPEKMAQTALFCLSLAALLIVYYLVLVKPHLADYQFYYSTNVYSNTQSNLLRLGRGVLKALYYGRHADLILFPLALAGLVYLPATLRELRRHPLLWVCGLWMAVYLAMIGTQDYVPPRYYTSLVIPMAILVALVADHLLKDGRKSVRALIFASLVLISLGSSGTRIVNYLTHPAYSWAGMNADLKRQVVAGGDKEPVLLGHFANSITLATGIFSINDVRGSGSLEERIERYHPTHYVSLGPPEASIAAILNRHFLLEKLGEYSVFDNYYTGQPVVLYKLAPR